MSYKSASQRGRFHSLFLFSLFSHILRHCLRRLRRLLFPPPPLQLSPRSVSGGRGKVRYGVGGRGGGPEPPLFRCGNIFAAASGKKSKRRPIVVRTLVFIPSFIKCAQPYSIQFST